MSKPDMKFEHTYITEQKMGVGGDDVFATGHKSYIADGVQALNDNIIGNYTRDQVMSRVRANLRQQMAEVNTASNREAQNMQQAHERLRMEMQQALLRAREAELNKRAAQRQAEDIDTFRIRTARTDGSTFFKMICKLGLVNSVDDDLREMAQSKLDIADKQEAIANRQMETVRRKAADWNAMRHNVHENVTFRKYYDAFDEAAARYHMINREANDEQIPAKDVKEYVGEFDMERLNDTFINLSQNPDAQHDIAFKNKKAGRGNSPEELIKAHTRMTFLSQADDNGNVIRFKLNSNFEGYKAARQFRERGSTALSDREQAFVKVNETTDRMRLQVDEKDASGQAFINSENNIEIRQATQKKWFGAKTLNGIFLNGQFISTDYSVIKGKEDSSLGAFTTWNSAKEREKVRKAVLKASIFRQINSKTIQHAMGYGASSDTKSDKIMEKIEEETRKPEFDGMDAGELERILTGNDMAAKNQITSPIKTKIIYDVLKDLSGDRDINTKLTRQPDYRGSVLLNAVKNDRKALKDAAMLLLSHNDQPKYWDIARTICDHYLGGRFKYTLKKARAEHGQMMRVALIDEINAKRDRLDLEDPIGALVPIKWKQFNDEVNAQRGFGAGLLQKVLDGTVQGFLTDAFDSVSDVTKGLDDTKKGLGRGADIASAYAGVLSAAMDMGVFAEGGAYLISDFTMKDEVYKNEDGELVHTSDERRGSIAYHADMIKNLVKLVSIMYKFYKKQKKEIDDKYDGKPDLKSREFLAGTESAMFKAFESILMVLAGIGKSVSNRYGEKQLKSIYGGIQNLFKTVSNIIGAVKENHAVNLIIDREKEFKSAISRVEGAEGAGPEQQGDVELVRTLKNNSQLQYGLACAKRNHRNKRLAKIFGAISSGGKTLINGAKAFFPALAKTKVFKVAEAVWGTAVSGVQMVTEMVRSKLAVKANIEKMLGKEFRGVGAGTLNSVLRREVGIVSADYLTDLARIFMSIDTHVFMQEATTDTEKEIGVKIARTLLDNRNIKKNNLKKVDIGKLMGNMGVEGHFRQILKYSLT